MSYVTIEFTSKLTVFVILFNSYVTTTFVVESMATTNAMLKLSKLKQMKRVSHYLCMVTFLLFGLIFVLFYEFQLLNNISADACSTKKCLLTSVMTIQYVMTDQILNHFFFNYVTDLILNNFFFNSVTYQKLPEIENLKRETEFFQNLNCHQMQIYVMLSKLD